MFFKSKVPTVDAKTLKQWMDNDKEMILLDVRTEQEWKETGIIPGALTVPNFRIVAEMQNGLNLDKGITVVTICRSGSRSKQVAEYLLGQNIEAINLNHGMMGWYQQQYDVERV